MTKRVQVVEDDPDILEAMQMMLEAAGYEVVAVSRAEKAFSQAQAGRPDLILIDLLLSGKNGVKIVQELKSEESTKEIPIVMLSAHPGAAKMIEASGANAFLPKPFDIDELLSLVKKYTGG